MREYFATQHEWDKFVISKYRQKQCNAKDRGLEFTLTFRSMDNLLRSKKCAYTGVKLSLPKEGSRLPSDITIERVNPDLGYVPGNVIAICYLANNMKSMTENNGLQGMTEIHMILSKALKRINKSKK